MKLRFLSDCRSLAFLGAYYAVFFLGWFWFLGQFEFYNLAFFPPKHAPWLLGVVVLLCVINFMVAITIHNSVHCPVFVGRNWNRAHRILLTLAFGAPASGYVPGHNLSHHKHLQTAKDNTRTY